MEEKEFKKFNNELGAEPDKPVERSTGTRELMDMFRMGD